MNGCRTPIAVFAAICAASASPSSGARDGEEPIFTHDLSDRNFAIGCLIGLSVLASWSDLHVPALVPKCAVASMTRDHVCLGIAMFLTVPIIDG